MNDLLWDAVQEVEYRVISQKEQGFDLELLSGPLSGTELYIKDINVTEEGMLVCDYDLIELDDVDHTLLKEQVAGVLKKILLGSIDAANHKFRQD